MFKIFCAHFKTNLAVHLQYRVALGIRMMGTVLLPIIYLATWWAVADTKGGTVRDFTKADFAAYYIAMMVINHVTFTWLAWNYEFRIRHGALSSLLSLPTHPIYRDFAQNISYKVISFFMIAPAVLIVSLMFKPHFQFTIASAVFFGLALLFSYALRFLLELNLAMTAFWFTRIKGIGEVYFFILFFTSGQVAPISFLPDWLREAVRFMPFYLILGFPAEVVLNKLSHAEIVNGMIMQGIWAIACVCGVCVLWRSGIRRYSAVGA
jgi:ABC-2 type transport system permease protein